MKKDTKIRLFAGSVMLFMIIFPFAAFAFPQIIPFVAYPIVALAIAFFPAIFAYSLAPILAHRIVRIYEFSHGKLKHSFRIYEGRTKNIASWKHASIFSSLYPLGLIFRITDNPVTLNEIDMQFVSLILVIQFLTIVFSYAVFIISRAKLMVEFNNGETRFNLGDKLRGYMNIGFFGSYILIFSFIFNALSSNHYLFFITLAIAIAICFGSNIIGFYMLEKTKNTKKSVIELKRILRDSNYTPEFFRHGKFT